MSKPVDDVTRERRRIYRARYKRLHRAEYQAQKDRYYHKYSGTDAKRHMRWTPEECRLIVDHKVSDRELSMITGRSIRAIQVKRSHLKHHYYDNN